MIAAPTLPIDGVVKAVELSWIERMLAEQVPVVIDESIPVPAGATPLTTVEEIVEYLSGYGFTMQEMTCYNCTEYTRCEYAWDSYNTAGDCLASK